MNVRYNPATKSAIAKGIILILNGDFVVNVSLKEFLFLKKYKIPKVISTIDGTKNTKGYDSLILLTTSKV
jgi:hypothetical protein